MDIILGAVSLGGLWAVMALGVFITYRVLDYADLTVEGSIVTGAAIAAKLISMQINPVVATVVSIFGGVAAGAVTGFLNTKLKISGLLSGILSMIALYSINIRIMGKANITLLRSKTVFTMIESLGIPQNIAVILLGFVIVAILIALAYWFFGTEIGCAIRATGDNRKMARAQGVDTDKMKILTLMISNGLVALSGALIAQNQSFADMTMGQGTIVLGLASVIIGEVIFYRKVFLNRLISVALGAVLYRIIIATVIELRMNPLDLKLFTAITVAIALALPQFKGPLASVFSKLSNSSGDNNQEKEGGGL